MKNDRMKVLSQVFCTSLFVFFAPIGGTIVLIGMAVMLDTLFGIIRSIRLKQTIVSRKLFRFAYKSFVYMTFIMLFFAFDRMLLNEFVSYFFSVKYALTKILAIVMVSIELYSIDENIRLMNNDKGFKYYATKILKDVKSGKQELNELK